MKKMMKVALVLCLSLLLGLFIAFVVVQQNNKNESKINSTNSTSTSKSTLLNEDASVLTKTKEDIKKGENINKVTFESGERNDKYLFSGKKSSVLIQNWKLEVNSTGEEILKIPFTFTNKTNKTINMNDYIQDRIVVQQLSSFNNNKQDFIKINNLTKEVLVGAHQKYPGTLTIPISEKDKVGFAFGVRYVKNGSFGALQVIHDIKNDPKKF